MVRWSYLCVCVLFLTGTASAEIRSSDSDPSLVQLEQSVESARTALDTVALVDALGALADWHEEHGAAERAADRRLEAADVAEASGEIEDALYLRRKAAESLISGRRFDRASALLHRVLEQATEHPQTMIRTRGTLARLERHRGDYSAALAQLRLALDATEAHGIDANTHLRLMQLMAVTLDATGRPREALRWHDRSQAVVSEPTPTQRCQMLNNRANVLVSLGDHAGALKSYERALAVADSLGLRRRAGIYRANAGNCLLHLGDLQEALTRLEAAEKDFRTGGALSLLPHVARDQAVVHLSLGHVERARELLRRSLELLDSSGSRHRRAATLKTLARVEERAGDLDAARRWYRRALSMAREVGSPEEEIAALLPLVDLDLQEAALDSAAHRLERAHGLCEEGASAESRNRTLRRTGQLALLRGHPEQAIESLREAWALASASRSPGDQWSAALLLARAHRELGEIDSSLDAFDRSLAAIEKLRRGPTAESERWGVFARGAAVYAEKAFALLDSERPPYTDATRREVFALSERMRARTLLERLRRGGAADDTDLPDSLRHAQAEVEIQLGRVRRALLSAQAQLEGSGAEGSRDSLRQAVHDLEDQDRRLEERAVRLEATAEARRSALSPLPTDEPPSLEEVQAALPPDALLLEFLVSPDGEGLLLALGPGQPSRILRLEPEVIERAAAWADRLRDDDVGGRPDRGELHREAADLSRALLADARPAEAARPLRRLYVVADGPLHRLAFAALVDPWSESGRWLFQDLDVIVVPSAGALVELHQRQSHEPSERPADVLVVVTSQVSSASDPSSETRGRDPHAPLPFAAVEGENVVAAWGEDRAMLLRGDAACEHRVKQTHLDRYSILHFATHAWTDHQNPHRSSLLLRRCGDDREDGLLTWRELQRLPTAADLVVLSACATADGARVIGEGVLDLARPFLVSGSSCALVTLWPVEDEPAAAFMRRFHTALAAGKAPTEALRQAQEAQLHSPRPAWRLPRHWAGYVLVGRPSASW